MGASVGALSDMRWSQASEVIADLMGLHFPRERWTDLQRGLTGAAEELGLRDVSECIDWLLITPLRKKQLQILASHLTIGETYFFRERKTFEVLAESVLPELISSRRGREQRLRLWSAGCSSGEEAYSLAILLRQVVPDLADWHVTILGTDIDARSLRKAVAGSYGEWSFRDAPDGFKERYFDRSEDGRHVVAREIGESVTFAHLNLVEDVYPSLATATNAIDLIFCRNVLMYFTPAKTRKAIENLYRCLVDGGWLVVSPSEASHTLFPQFELRNFPGVILYRKREGEFRGRQPRTQPPIIEDAQPVSSTYEETILRPSLVSAVPVVEPKPLSTPENQGPQAALPRRYAIAESFYREGRYEEAAATLMDSIDGQATEQRRYSLLARSLANRGNLIEALAWCERWIATDKLDFLAYYLSAVILMERGDTEYARRSLQSALYLKPDFPLAHFAFGNLARSQDRNHEANKHYTNALHLLNGFQPDEILPESDGLTVGRLAETIAALTFSGDRQ